MITTFKDFLLLEKSPPGMEDVPEKIKESGVEDFRAFQIAWKQFRELVLDHKDQFKEVVQIYKNEKNEDKVKIINWKETAKIVKELRKEQKTSSSKE